MEHQLREQCADLETASKYLLHKKKMVVGVIGLNLLKLCFWYGMPYLLFAGDKNINLVETMAITALSVMLAAVIPAPAGIGSTEFVFTGLFAGIVGTGIAGSRLCYIVLLLLFFHSDRCGCGDHTKDQGTAGNGKSLGAK